MLKKVFKCFFSNSLSALVTELDSVIEEMSDNEILPVLSSELLSTSSQQILDTSYGLSLNIDHGNASETAVATHVAGMI